MIKKLLATVLALFAAAVFAASADVNKASQAELEAVKGIGPAIAGKILDERKKGQFKDWNDMIERVKGVGEGNAAKFSAEGLTVNGAAFAGAAPAAKAAKADKPAAKTTTAAAPAASAAAKGDAKADAKAEKEAKKAAKAASAAEKKAAKAAAAKASEPAPKK